MPDLPVRRCAFCGAVESSTKPLRTLEAGRDADRVEVLVCADPRPMPDKPTPASCAWKFCARRTGGMHRPDDAGSACLDCGKPSLAAR